MPILFINPVTVAFLTVYKIGALVSFMGSSFLTTPIIGIVCFGLVTSVYLLSLLNASKRYHRLLSAFVFFATGLYHFDVELPDELDEVVAATEEPLQFTIFFGTSEVACRWCDFYFKSRLCISISSLPSILNSKE